MTTPDPQLVREIAREHIRSGRGDLGITIELMPIGTILSREELAAWEEAVRQATRTATVSWPDEQAQATVATEAARRLEATVARYEDTIARYATTASDYRIPLHYRHEHCEITDALHLPDLRAVLADRAALAARVAELEAEPRFRIAPDREFTADEVQALTDRFTMPAGRLAFLAAADTDRIAALGEQDDAADEPPTVAAAPAGHGPGVPGAMHLEAFGQAIEAAFGECPYHVGSSATSKTWRDVDVRLILDDDRFAALFPGFTTAHHIDAWWSLLCAALSELGRKRTGLPIDFQIQSMTDANEKYPTGIRNPLFLIRAEDDHRPTMLPAADRDDRADARRSVTKETAR